MVPRTEIGFGKILVIIKCIMICKISYILTWIMTSIMTYIMKWLRFGIAHIDFIPNVFSCHTKCIWGQNWLWGEYRKTLSLFLVNDYKYVTQGSSYLCLVLAAVKVQLKSWKTYQNFKKQKLKEGNQQSTFSEGHQNITEEPKMLL